MTVGEKIKRIRTFRGMTQKELGLAVGFPEKGADNRIAQYETNYRVPKEEMLRSLAKALRVSEFALYVEEPGLSTGIIQTLFWLEEEHRGIHLFQLVRNPGKTNACADRAVRYYDNDDWPALPPIGLYFDYIGINNFLKEWLRRQEELRAGEITRDEYFEWKINWPFTCDGGENTESYVPWRKEK